VASAYASVPCDKLAPLDVVADLVADVVVDVVDTAV
jgi:hypothetical protein